MGIFEKSLRDDAAAFIEEYNFYVDLGFFEGSKVFSEAIENTMILISVPCFL